jgi:hypothetical protein
MAVNLIYQQLTGQIPIYQQLDGCKPYLPTIGWLNPYLPTIGLMELLFTNNVSSQPIVGR